MSDEFERVPYEYWTGFRSNSHSVFWRHALAAILRKLIDRICQGTLTVTVDLQSIPPLPPAYLERLVSDALDTLKERHQVVVSALAAEITADREMPQQAQDANVDPPSCVETEAYLARYRLPDSGGS